MPARSRPAGPIRWRASTSVLAALLLLVVTAPSRAQAVDTSGRERADIASAAFGAVGQVNTAAYGRCTGVLIDRATAVTAAHCLFNRATGRFLQPSSVHFVLGYDRGAYAFRTVAREIRMDPAQDGSQTLGSAPRDWAVLVLADPAPTSITPMPIADGAPASGDALTAAGFGRDRAYALTVARDCRAIGQAAADLLAMRCPIIQGYSGGPVMNAQDHLLGIAVATTKSEAGEIALAVQSRAWKAASER